MAVLFSIRIKMREENTRPLKIACDLSRKSKKERKAEVKTAKSRRKMMKKDIKV